MTKPEEPPPLVRVDTVDPAADESDYDYELFDAQEKAKTLKALFATRVYAAPDGEHLRIILGERVGDENIYHTALVMPLESALELGRLLVRMAEAGVSLKLERYREFLAQSEAPEDQSNG